MLEGLKEFTKSEHEKEILEAYTEASGNASEAARALGKDPSNLSKVVRRVRVRAAKQGYSPDHDMTKTAAEGFDVKGTSTLYDADGNITAQWVKTQVSAEEAASLLEDVREALCKDIKPAQPIPEPASCFESVLAVYPFGDPHVGVQTYFSETGEDFDLAKAEQLFTSAMDRAVDNAPPSERALIVNVGDYFHSDNAQNQTRKSKNPLDTSGAFTDRLMVGMRIMRNIIDKALVKHQHVTVINTIGNHDEHLSIALSAMLNAFYSDEPRVEIPIIERHYQYFTFGKCLFGVTHGDQCKPQDLESIMAADKPQEWGDSRHRYWLTGHIHHDVIKEFRGCKFESFRTLAPKDAWHNAAGYRSDRDLKTIIYHKDHGEVERYTINITQFQEV